MADTIRVDEASVKGIWDALQTIGENAGRLLQSLQDKTDDCFDTGMAGKYADTLKNNQIGMNANINCSSRNLEFMEDDVSMAAKTLFNVDLEIANNLKNGKG